MPNTVTLVAPAQCTVHSTQYSAQTTHQGPDPEHHARLPEVGHGVGLGPRLARTEYSRLRHLDTPDPGPELRELLLLQPLYYCQSLSQSEADTGPSQPIT